MRFDYSNLVGKIITKCGSKKKFFELMGISERAGLMKLHNQTEWKQSDIVKACEILNIPLSEVHNYFFTVEVK